MTEKNLTSTLVRGRFALEYSDGTAVVDGYHDPDNRWNGFVVPYLTADAVDVLASVFDHEQGDAQITRQADAVHLIEEQLPSDEPYVLPAETINDGTVVFHFDTAWAWTLAPLHDDAL